MSNRLLSTQDLADRLGIPGETLSQWRRQGKGPCFIQIGRMIRYSVHEVELFERQFKSRSDWVVGQLAPEPKKCHKKSIGGRLRRSEFSDVRKEAIITAYLEHLFSPDKITLPPGAMEDYVRLMTLKISCNDPVEGHIEIDKEQLTPEVLLVDLVNTLEKMTANINTVRSHARSKLPTFDPIALQQAVDQFADMATRRHVRKWAGKQ